RNSFPIYHVRRPPAHRARLLGAGRLRYGRPVARLPVGVLPRDPCLQGRDQPVLGLLLVGALIGTLARLQGGRLRALVCGCEAPASIWSASGSCPRVCGDDAASLCVNIQ
ncbi:hypothetical protein T484DRAFT_2024828, partial [Baffinella frigidus]